MGSVYVQGVIEYLDGAVYRPLLLVEPEGAALFALINDSYALRPEEKAALERTVHPWTRTQYERCTDTMASEMLWADLHQCEEAARRRRERGKDVPAEFAAIMNALDRLGHSARLVYWWENS